MKLNTELRILSIDPGVTTGLASWDPITRELKSWEAKLSHDEFIQTLSDFWPDIIVCESFEHTHRDGTDYTPVEYIGLVKWYAERKPVELIFQTPGYGKGYFNNDKLKKLKLYTPAMGHAMDAYRHLLQYAMQQKLFDLRLLK